MRCRFLQMTKPHGLHGASCLLDASRAIACLIKRSSPITAEAICSMCCGCWPQVRNFWFCQLTGDNQTLPIATWPITCTESGMIFSAPARGAAAFRLKAFSLFRRSGVYPSADWCGCAFIQSVDYFQWCRVGPDRQRFTFTMLFGACVGRCA